ncbi:rhomboid family intramembrane serine protease [Natronohydrobacter thiooxidans]|uniref:rhomboid family intramembrane serine protease n=1 Tax=Natronohydrobacter thiooxidans TaxID=87172 RepID=UPI0008FF226D|nr:rhomboid family intramembrane serine protease [Natronohydrobacter thiooxidans]
MRNPVLNPLPWSVWLLTLAIAGVELVLWAGAHGLVNWAGSPGWRAQALALAGINPGLQGWMVETGQTPLPHLARYLGFGLVHQGPLQAALVIVITAALGKVCAEGIGSLRLLLVLAFAQAAGGFAFGLAGSPDAWLIGGYPLIFALAGCFAGQVWHGESSALSRRKALGLVAVLILGRLALAALVGGGMDWIADLVACLAGYALGRVLRPGLRARLRRA